MDDRVRVYELARQMNLSNQDVINALRELGYDVKSHSTTIDKQAVGLLIAHLGKRKKKRKSTLPLNLSPVSENIRAARSSSSPSKPPPSEPPAKPRILARYRPKPRIWQDNWKEVSSLGRGGQGRTSVVEKFDHPEVKGVLKLLRSPTDEQARERLDREVRSLRSLKEPGIVKLLDSNTAHYENPDIELYLVSEYIDGVTLSKRLELHDLEKSLVFTLSLLESLEHCHEVGIVHRDIKPSNIILRAGELERPVLIDFGLSYNADWEDDTLTRTSEHVGNRFLDLPEQNSRINTDKRDKRSDLTLCCGVLFFLLTGESPRTLLDERERPPHKRPHLRESIDRFPRRKGRDHLDELFDTGFQWNIDLRFQNAADLRSGLESILEIVWKK